MCLQKLPSSFCRVPKSLGSSPQPWSSNEHYSWNNKSFAWLHCFFPFAAILSMIQSEGKIIIYNFPPVHDYWTEGELFLIHSPPVQTLQKFSLLPWFHMFPTDRRRYDPPPFLLGESEDFFEISNVSYFLPFLLWRHNLDINGRTLILLAYKIYNKQHIFTTL